MKFARKFNFFCGVLTYRVTLIRSEVGFIGFYNAQYRFCVRLFPSL